MVISLSPIAATYSPTVPMILAVWDRKSQLKKDDLIVLAAFGGGFTWGATLVKWGY